MRSCALKTMKESSGASLPAVWLSDSKNCQFRPSRSESIVAPESRRGEDSHPARVERTSVYEETNTGVTEIGLSVGAPAYGCQPRWETWEKGARVGRGASRDNQADHLGLVCDARPRRLVP